MARATQGRAVGLKHQGQPLGLQQQQGQLGQLGQLEQREG
jgi:hypothetical protein